MSNRLASATSPYLLQHADNPVDWREWGEEAFAEARRRDVPVLLSVGYAACHWCHVMAHESFEDQTVAAAVNGRFVAVKVDREERPDVDAVYMAATTTMTGHGGWPMTCFLTPDGEPFHCGTYYPREQFLMLLDGVTEAWTQRREAVTDQGASITAAVRRTSAPLTPDLVDDAVLDRAARLVTREADPARGGFGGAPKFPPSMTLEHLLRHHARTGDPTALSVVEHTCEAMARGGIYDQLAGGFSRYSVDAAWVVPHFEKMLYDNAQLLRVYLHLYRTTGSALAERVVRETAGFLLADLRTPEGGFASALDADAGGVEGLTYVWTPGRLAQVLGPDDGARAARVLSVTPEGTFEPGSSTLQLREDPDPVWWARVRARLAEERASRPQPARDDKVVTAWNGLAIAALAEAGTLLGSPAYIEAARECATLVLRLHLVEGRLRRASRAGRVGTAPGIAADHGDLAEGLLALHQATGEARWLEAAGDLLDTASARFGDDTGGFFDVADDAERLLSRPRDPTDGPEPAGQSSLAGALCTYAALTGSPRHREAAEAAVDAAGGPARQVPRFAGWTLAVAEALAAGPVQVAVVGHDDADRAALERTARGATAPGLVIAVGEPDAPGMPLLADRPLVGGRAAAYVCRGFVCDRPVTTVQDLARQLAG
ncbi:thioredoxin domain-containing protein [Myceligenerans indicum]|uniref:Thioredoxin domain-containing protein n=1 Tax=Myceligenerans indicum TaxID=2593663 RepID=A0ABS1LRP9_9MICO|nr:thioredoxin domain-containing protein [Myceligenerans indicum]MBL0888688.1 thioredoxin domain-containing protein [Myceligenerans indicum]